MYVLLQNSLWRDVSSSRPYLVFDKKIVNQQTCENGSY